MNTFVIRAESTLTLAYIIDPPTERMNSYPAQTVETEFLASRNTMLKVAIRGAIHLLDFAICEPSCGAFVYLYLIDIIAPHLTGKFPDPMIHLLSQTAWHFDLPNSVFAISDSLLLLANHTDPSSFRLMLLADADSYKMTPGIELKSSLKYKHIESTTSGLLVVLHQDDVIEVFRCRACSSESIRSDASSLNQQNTTQEFGALFSRWQIVDHGLTGVSNIRVQQLPGGMIYLFVWTSTEAKIFVAHSGTHQTLQWSTKFVYLEKAGSSDEGAKITDVFANSEMLKYLRPSSKIVVVSSKKAMIQAHTFHFCHPNEQAAENYQNCVPLEGSLVRLDWKPTRDPLACAGFDSAMTDLEQVTWAAFCLPEAKAPAPDESSKPEQPLKQQLESSAVFGSVDEAGLQSHLACLSITSSNRCNYKKDCIFDPEASKCQLFDFSANSRFLTKESKYHFYETGRLAWELLISKNLWRSPGVEGESVEITDSTFRLEFNSSKKIER
jgi:hypothetical protein